MPYTRKPAEHEQQNRYNSMYLAQDFRIRLLNCIFLSRQYECNFILDPLLTRNVKHTAAFISSRGTLVRDDIVALSTYVAI